MTGQISENLSIHGKPFSLMSFPLSRILEEKGIAFRGYKCRTTACWRGYIADWRIDDSRLYLAGFRLLSLSSKDQPEAERRAEAAAQADALVILLAALEEPSLPILASWVTETLHVSQLCGGGRFRGWTHIMPGDAQIDVENGIVRAVSRTTDGEQWVPVSDVAVQTADTSESLPAFTYWKFK